MAKYTIELRDIVENREIFNFHYPFYDEKKRPEFEQHFIRHFYFREIGAETVDRFLWYLRDKMETVFPFYNELLKTAQIEYDKVNNYDMTETQTIKREREEKGSGVSSTVGRLYDKQEGNTDRTGTVDRTENIKGAGSETVGENTNTVTTQDTDETATTTNDKTQNTGSTTTQTVAADTDATRKHLDTPGGSVTNIDANYLTNMDTEDANTTTTTDGETTGTLHETDEQSTARAATIDGTSDTERTLTGSTENTTDTSGKETSADNVKVTSSQEQGTTSDNNTRTESLSKDTETLEHRRFGNIGVTTASDMLVK